MIDLHVHLDGSLTPEQVFALGKLQGVELPGESPAQLKPFLTASPDCESLNMYLRCFSLPVRVLQSEESLFLAVKDLAARMAEQGLVYGEIRFAPQLHGEKGLTQMQAVKAALRGLEQSKKEHPAFTGQLILCCMRGGEEAANRETLQVAARTLGQGVCAVDLAGAEALYPTKAYAPLFAQAARTGIPFTLHAGEAAGPESVWEALEMGARRIGHGVRSREDPRLVEVLAERGIPLELCATSNVQTKAVTGYEDFPLRAYVAKGLLATVNTDNMTVSGTTVAQEFRRLAITLPEAEVLLHNSVQAAFLSEEQKAQLQAQVDGGLEAWYANHVLPL